MGDRKKAKEAARPKKRARGRAAEAGRLRDSLSGRITVGFAGYLLRTACLFLPLALCCMAFVSLLFLRGVGRTVARGDAYDAARVVGEKRMVVMSPLGMDAAPENAMALYAGLLHADGGRVYVCMDFQAREAGGVLRVGFDVTGMLWLSGGALLLWLAFEGARMAFLAHHNDRVNQKLATPISDIGELARRLSASNLDQRIDVTGVNGELKSLCVIVNDMLDRIAGAYNVQKQFVSDASHELRTPIAVIQGYADMLDRWGKSDPEVRDEAISAIRSEAEGMKELVEQLLFLARHDNKRFVLESEYFNAAELTEEAGRDLKLIAGAHEVAVAPLESCIIKGDRASLKQAIRVFVDNALKFTPDGGKITLSCRHEKTYCRITVADDGIGIGAEDLTRIFERFYRAEQAHGAGAPGHGLGLSIARIIVLQHGGKIEVQSKLGVGSRFHILIPT